MPTLREVLENKGFTPTQLAGQADISVSTLYKMYKKKRVSSQSVANVCRVLGITREEYNQLQTDTQ